MEAYGLQSIRDVDGGPTISTQVFSVSGSFSIETIHLLDIINCLFPTGTICGSIRTFRSISEHNLDRSES